MSVQKVYRCCEDAHISVYTSKGALLRERLFLHNHSSR